MTTIDVREVHDLFKDYPRSVLDRFKKYHADNPHIYEMFKDLAFEMQKSGRKRYSAEVIVNVMRWHFDLKSTSGEVFEINNDFKPIYARLLIYHHPEMKDFFEFRKIRSKGIKSQDQKQREAAREIH